MTLHDRDVLKPRATFDPFADASAFQDSLVAWFQRDGKDYPWRRTSDPYEILVSEVMLQQTQIATVLGRGFYRRFLAQFPDIQSLAVAEDEPLLKAWEGLGYYRRVRMLRKTAQAVLAAGSFPEGLKELEALPGVGRYTANAVRAFAFNLPAAVVDGNVARVLARMLDFREAVDAPAGLKALWKAAERLADKSRPRLYNSALMELGQTYCRPGVPDCLACPVALFCKTRTPEVLPVKVPKRKVEKVRTHVLWCRDASGRILLKQEKGNRRQGLWKLPERPCEETAGLPEIATRKYAITRFQVTMHIHEGSAGVLEGEAWLAPEEIDALPMASPYRKALEFLCAKY